LQDDYELKIKYFEQECEKAEFMSNDWKKTIARKVDLILEAINENWG